MLMAERSSSDAAGSEQSASTYKSVRNGRDSPETLSSPKQPGNGGSSSRAERAGLRLADPLPSIHWRAARSAYMGGTCSSPTMCFLMHKWSAGRIWQSREWQLQSSFSVSAHAFQPWRHV